MNYMRANPLFMRADVFLSSLLLAFALFALPAHGTSNSSGPILLDAFTAVDVTVYELPTDGNLNMDQMEAMPKCSNGLKVVIEPGDSYSIVGVSAPDVFEVRVNNSKLHFFRSGYKPGHQAPPGATITVQMPSRALTSLFIGAGNGVELTPGANGTFELDTLDIAINGDARLFSSSLCATQFGTIQMSEGAQAKLAIPQSCGNVSIESLQIADGASLGLDLDLRLNAAQQVVSGAEVNGGKWVISSGAKASVSAGSGKVDEVDISGGSAFYSKGIDVELLSGTNGAVYAVEDGAIGEQKTFGGAARTEFQVEASEVDADSLGPWFMTDCSYSFNEDYTIPWWVTLIGVLLAALVLAGGTVAVVRIFHRQRQANKHVVHVSQFSVTEDSKV